jgi:exonuclease VII small subunit
VSALSFEEQQQLSSIVQDNYLVLPLLDDGKLLGAALLAGKSEGFSQEDQRLMGELQPTISTVLKNLYQYEGLRKVSLLRSEYCMELSRAVESTLDRIREEVQSIYSRLGKLTPYYKQHCETILFEVGKLYEIIQEAREMEQPAQPTSEPARLASES